MYTDTSSACSTKSSIADSSCSGAGAAAFCSAAAGAFAAGNVVFCFFCCLRSASRSDRKNEVCFLQEHMHCMQEISALR